MRQHAEEPHIWHVQRAACILVCLSDCCVCAMLLVFRTDRANPGLVLSADGRAATKIGVAGYNVTLLCTPPPLVSGCYTYRVRVRGSAGAFTGFAPATALDLSPNNTLYQDGGWYMYHADGRLFAPGDVGVRNVLGRAVMQNEVVTIIYDTRAHSISYQLGTAAPIVAYENVMGELCPAILPNESGSIVELC